MVSKGGQTYWVPAVDKEMVSINSIERWNQAFRVYTKIFMKGNPTRGEELLEYSYVINSIAGTYSWNNVYKYDKLFRLHMAKHKGRNWEVILQQAWAFCLTNKISQGEDLHKDIQAERSMIIKVLVRRQGEFASNTTKVCVPMVSAASLNTNVEFVVNTDMVHTSVGR